MIVPVKLGVLSLSLLFVIGLTGCKDQEAEKRAQIAEERAVAAEKRAAIAEEKLLILEKQLNQAKKWSEADRKATEGRFEKSTEENWLKKYR